MKIYAEECLAWLYYSKSYSNQNAWCFELEIVLLTFILISIVIQVFETKIRRFIGSLPALVAQCVEM